MKFSEYYLCFHNSCEIWLFFLLGSCGKLSLVLLQITYHVYSPWKVEKIMQCCLNNIILVQSFCPLKIKITQFLSGFHFSHQLHSTNNGQVLFLILLLGIDTASCQLLQWMALHTWLIPGKFSIFPIIGTLLKKLITTGKNPLRRKTEAVTML